MDLQTYWRQREVFLNQEPKYRALCVRCLQPQFSCYCAHIHSFDPKIKFVILIHPIEMKRRIATGRMSHLCLENSELIVGQDYTKCERVNEIIDSPRYQSTVLYPGTKSLNLSVQSEEKKAAVFSSTKIPVVFVIDGTWATARKTMYQSQNLNKLPRLCFTPPGRSQFRVRKQPGADCYSTIEAIHHLIDLLGSRQGFDISTRKHDRLIHVFNQMVERQLDFVREAYENPRATAYRRVGRSLPPSVILPHDPPVLFLSSQHQAIADGEQT